MPRNGLQPIPNPGANGVPNRRRPQSLLETIIACATQRRRVWCMRRHTTAAFGKPSVNGFHRIIGKASAAGPRDQAFPQARRSQARIRRM